MLKKGRSPIKETKEFEEEVIQIDRVTRVVKGGRRLRFRATVVIGNRKGKVGIGIGKSTEVTGAIQKAVNQAKKSLIHVPIIGQTIPHKIQVKFKAAKLMIMPACPGTGLIAGGPLRKVLELAGVQDVLSKSIGCNNRVTNTQAALIALTRLKNLPWVKVINAEEAEKVKIAEAAKAAQSSTQKGRPVAKPFHRPAQNNRPNPPLPAKKNQPVKPMEKNITPQPAKHVVETTEKEKQA